MYYANTTCPFLQATFSQYLYDRRGKNKKKLKELSPIEKILLGDKNEKNLFIIFNDFNDHYYLQRK